MPERDPILQIEDLTVDFGDTRALDGASLELRRGEKLALVGDSGSGKSVLALAVLGLVDPPGRRVSGSIRSEGVELTELDEAGLRAVRGGKVAMIFQEPQTALNPVLTIGAQVAEAVALHADVDAREAARRAVVAFRRVGLPDPERLAGEYPHRLSGGMRQRVMIAMAVAMEPRVLIADEPTSALDATVQAQILDLLDDLVREDGLSVLLISHDLAVVAGFADRTAVMTAGRIVECAPTRELFEAPVHAHTRALLRALRNVEHPVEGHDAAQAPLLEVRDLRVSYPRAGGGRRRLRAVDGVSFSIASGEGLGLVGESGCGKSTLGRAVLGLIPAEAGDVDLACAPREVQIVFQDPYGSLNPRHTVRRIVGEAPSVHGLARGAALTEHVVRALEAVGLSGAVLDRFPHEFSGGQRQRISIARALALEPRLLVLDEATSALDASVRGEIIDLLAVLERERGIALLFISHDLDAVRRLCDRVAVMYLGRIVELGPTAGVLEQPAHPYTRALLDALPVADPSVARLPAALVGEPPSPGSPPPGCRFHPRCPLVEDRCRDTAPPSIEAGPDHRAECHLVE